MNFILSFVLGFVIILVVPILVYSFFVKFAELKEPDKKLSFMVSVLVQKLGTAFGFVALYAIGKDYFNVSWFAYGLIWFVMYAIVEIGQAIGPDYSKKEAVAGIISEFIYFPLAAFTVMQLMS